MADKTETKPAAEPAAKAEEKPLTETVEGGVYADAGGKTFHDAEGRAVTKAGKLINPEE